jgi:hypothetical protein
VALREVPEPQSRLQRVQAAALGLEPTVVKPAGFTLLRRAKSPTSHPEGVSYGFARKLFERAKERANFAFYDKNGNHDVSAATTASEILQTQDREGVEFDVFGVKEIQVPVEAFMRGHSDEQAQALADATGTEVAVFTPHYLLSGKRSLSARERAREVIGGIGIFSRHPVVPGSDIIVPLLRRADGADEVGGARRKIDYYRNSYGVPVLVAAQIEHPASDTPLTIATAHFPPAFEGKRQQLAVARNLAEAVEQLGVDIVGVDTNAAPDTQTMRLLFDAAERADDKTDMPTYNGILGPTRLDPFKWRLNVRQRVDYVLKSRKSKISDTAGLTTDQGSSDHRGLLVVGRV